MSYLFKIHLQNHNSFWVFFFSYKSIKLQIWFKSRNQNAIFINQHAILSSPTHFALSSPSHLSLQRKKNKVSLKKLIPINIVGKNEVMPSCFWVLWWMIVCKRKWWQRRQRRRPFFVFKKKKRIKCPYALSQHEL